MSSNPGPSSTLSRCRPYAPGTVAQVAARFRRTRPERVRPLLDTLTALALVRPTPEGAYAG
ncbi:MAG: hypothetical protein EOO63_14285 [Hymenobacter sp.]|nr:MAG: hypothetical protein EOO63_14285 [Hymenobacter sp.]